MKSTNSKTGFSFKIPFLIVSLLVGITAIAAIVLLPKGWGAAPLSHVEAGQDVLTLDTPTPAMNAPSTAPPNLLINPSIPSPPPASAHAPAPNTAADYAFYWFTDAQYYSASYPETFYAMTAWMRDHAEEYNVKYAFFTGDIINTNSSNQWGVAREAMRQLEEAVPVFTIAGNHDVGASNPDYTNFNTYFGSAHYTNNTNIAEWYEGGKGRCDSVELDGTKYLFLGVGWGTGSDGIRWMNTQLSNHPDHKAILLLHDYMDSDGLLLESGRLIYEKVVTPHPNVFMVLCGHRYNCALLTTDINDNGDHNNYRRVYNIMMNYQMQENGGDGFLTLIRVLKKEKLILMDTYSPTLNQWYHNDPARNINTEQLALPVTIFD